MQLNVQTISTQASAKLKVNLGYDSAAVLVKNFGTDDIWCSANEGSTKTIGSVRIPPDTAQVIIRNAPNIADANTFFDSIYIYADSAMTDAVEIQPVR